MKKIAFLTATRAEYGKLKPLLNTIQKRNGISLHIFVTGMHLLEKFGNTYQEIIKDGFADIVCDNEYRYSKYMDISIAEVIKSFAVFVKSLQPDMIVVHGDRLDAMAGAIVGVFNNILVAHIEGGELSGTVDESIRHAISKLAHIHFVANDDAKTRLMQLGEKDDNIFVIGSPDVDVMLSGHLPAIDDVRRHYSIPFQEYAILLYHPVVTELENISAYISNIIDALRSTRLKYVTILPNNDPGNEIIRRAYDRLHERPQQFRILPSMRFEAFLTLLKYARFIIGNSSAGIREACVYATPAIDIGSRQQDRYDTKIMRNIIHVPSHAPEAIKGAIEKIPKHVERCFHFGSGGSAEAFYSIISSTAVWETPKQKRFVDFIGTWNV